MWTKIVKTPKVTLACEAINSHQLNFSKLKNKTPDNNVNCENCYTKLTTEYFEKRLQSYKYNKNEINVNTYIQESTYKMNYNNYNFKKRKSFNIIINYESLSINEIIKLRIIKKTQNVNN